MIVKLDYVTVPTVRDLIFQRHEQIAHEMNQNSEFTEAHEKIRMGYQIIKEKAPELYKEAIIDLIDDATGTIEASIQYQYYKQGLKDGLELKELLR